MTDWANTLQQLDQDIALWHLAMAVMIRPQSPFGSLPPAGALTYLYAAAADRHEKLKTQAEEDVRAWNRARQLVPVDMDAPGTPMEELGRGNRGQPVTT